MWTLYLYCINLIESLYILYLFLWGNVGVQCFKLFCSHLGSPVFFPKRYIYPATGGVSCWRRASRAVTSVCASWRFWRHGELRGITWAPLMGGGGSMRGMGHFGQSHRLAHLYSGLAYQGCCAIFRTSPLLSSCCWPVLVLKGTRFLGLYRSSLSLRYIYAPWTSVVLRSLPCGRIPICGGFSVPSSPLTCVPPISSGSPAHVGRNWHGRTLYVRLALQLLAVV